ncbi:MAG: Hsp20/alpha crystallin family protein [Betaproteobacteria bacterium]|jgi:HSP20 family protein
MVNLARVNVVDNTLDEMLRGFFVRPMNVEATAPVQLRIDVSETESGYTVLAEIPGVKKDDIQVAVDGNQIEISAEVRNGRALQDGEKVLRAERYCGKVHRAFALAHDIDDAATEARYVDGVLELKLPKKTSARLKRISIQ